VEQARLADARTGKMLRQLEFVAGASALMTEINSRHSDLESMTEAAQILAYAALVLTELAAKPDATASELIEAIGGRDRNRHDDRVLTSVARIASQGMPLTSP